MRHKHNYHINKRHIILEYNYVLKASLKANNNDPKSCTSKDWQLSKWSHLHVTLNWIYRIEPKRRTNRKKGQKTEKKREYNKEQRIMKCLYIDNEQRTIGSQIKKTETSFSWDIPKNNYYKSK